MKINFKYLAAAMAVAALVSCVKDELSDKIHESTTDGLVFSVENEAMVKSVIGESLTPVWTADDIISVNGIPCPSLESGAGKFDGSGVEASDSYRAVYPYAESNSFEGSVLSATLPAEQVVAAGQNVASGALVAACISESTVLKFKNCVALMQINIPIEGIKEVVITVDGEKEAIAGPFTMDLAADTLVVTAASKNTSKVITLKPAEGTFAPGTYYAAVLPGKVSGFTAKFTNEAGKSQMVTNKKEIEFERSNGKNVGTMFTYDIATAEDLISWAKGSGKFTAWDVVNLKGNISLTPEQAAQYKEANEFKGVFNGNGHKISGLTTPLFGNIRGGLVSDLEIEANITHNGKSTAQIVGTDFGIGILAHYLYREDSAYNHVKNVTVRGSVTIDGLKLKHNYMIGGMVGSSNNVSVSGCRNYAKVTVKTADVDTSEVRLGGLIGALQVGKTQYSDCENHGPVIVESVTTKGTVSVGGVFGHSTQPVEITKCRNYGHVDVKSVNVTGEVSAGGVLGFTIMAVKFTNCDNMETGNVSVLYDDKNVKWTSVGGIIGGATGKVTLTDCDNKAAILNANTAFDPAANYSTGGVAGKLKDSPIKNCTSSGDITGAGNVGGIIGYSTIANNNGITMTSCKSSGIIKSNCVGGDVHCIGGLAGCVVGKILKSSSTADIVSGDCVTKGVGGLAGGVNGSWFVVEESIYNGNITAHSQVGGILGRAETANNVRIDNSFSCGTITAADGFSGGLVGHVLLPSERALKPQ